MEAKRLQELQSYWDCQTILFDKLAVMFPSWKITEDTQKVWFDLAKEDVERGLFSWIGYFSGLKEILRVKMDFGKQPNYGMILERIEWLRQRFPQGPKKEEIIPVSHQIEEADARPITQEEIEEYSKTEAGKIALRLILKKREGGQMK